MNATGGQHSQFSSDRDISHLFYDEVKSRANLKKSDKSHSDTDVFFLGLSFRCFHRVNCSLLVLSGLCPYLTVVIASVDIDPERLYTPISHWD